MKLNALPPSPAFASLTDLTGHIIGVLGYPKALATPDVMGPVSSHGLLGRPAAI